MSQIVSGESWIQSPAKRAFDVAATAAVAPLLAPIAAAGALSFWAESGHNPLFIQDRIGTGGRVFKVLKLRTMLSSEDYNDPSNGAHDSRASRVGKFLRRLSIDELPQAFHILAGQMSVVGPRPLIPADIERTLDVLSPAEQREWQYARTVAPPGWFSEFGNVSRSLDPMSDEYVRTRAVMDSEYVGKASLETDWDIICAGLSRHRDALVG